MTSARDDAQRAARELLTGRIKEALIHTQGDKTKAAERLGMPRRALYRWIARLGLQDWRADGEPAAARPGAG